MQVKDQANLKRTESCMHKNNRAKKRSSNPKACNNNVQKCSSLGLQVQNVLKSCQARVHKGR